MIRDITLGQYFPGETAIHKMDPRTKILAMIAYIVITFCVKSFAGYIALADFLGYEPSSVLCFDDEDWD